MNTDALIVIGTENVRYLTGFRGHDSWALVLPGSTVLVTDSRYTEQAQGECIGCNIVQRKGSLSTEVQKILEKKRSVQRVGVEDACSVGLLKTLRKDLSVPVTPLKNIVENVRIVKTQQEIGLIRQAAKIAFTAMTEALRQIKIGMTERQLAALYEYRLSAYRAKPGFETIVCFGPNGSRNHHQPGERKLRTVDTILCDFGANYEGYISDITRTFAFGKITPRFRRVYETVARAQRAAIQSIRTDVRFVDVDTAAREQIRQAGLPIYGHGTGHGLGLQVHESPYLSATDKKGTLKAGQVITIEPGIYLPGEFGVRLEDDVLVTPSGGRVLTRNERYDISPEMVPLLKG
jgi:Xaa-Pro aminopeptidase